MIYNVAAETMNEKEIEQLQIEKLQTTLYRVYNNVSFYHNTFNQHKINIEKIETIEDLQKLPFTTKEDLRKSYPYNMFAVPLKDIIRLHSTSGTTGKPIVVGYTKNDLNHWTELVARLLVAAGVSQNDFVQIAFKYSLFTGGFGFHYGAEKIGALVIPSSSSENIYKIISIMKDYKTTVLLSTPSYAVNIIKKLDELNMHPENLFLKIGIFGAEPWSENLRTYIQNKLHIKAYDTYGLTEIIGPGVAGECIEQNGLHINEDHFIVEIIDPETLLPVKNNNEGEIVITTITKEAFPLIRYRTGDIASFIQGKCKCGRTFKRISRIKGRTDDLIFINGNKIFPSFIEQILVEYGGIKPDYQIIIDNEDGVDILIIKIAISDKIPSFDEIKQLERIKQKIIERIDSEFEIKAKIIFVEPLTLRQPFDSKYRYVIDNRKRI
ncbi:MAG TPA: phenylacetate--CoA ligase [bacterium]|nr:phenylacetate--CoA ligase [bacterium]HOL46647.1 phenylacetate--CoA ligase [bacterium]HPQ17782.1 phenylacetate--CoA ligase [bacterium]